MKRSSDFKSWSATEMAALRKELLVVARSAMKNAYAPYSNFRVGAALVLADGSVFSGCNVENASYGLTICAERNAVFAAVAGSKRKPEIIAAAVVNHRGIPCSPCGACRQVLAEFGPRATIWYLGANGIVGRSMQELLVDGFSLCPNEKDKG